MNFPQHCWNHTLNIFVELSVKTLLNYGYTFCWMELTHEKLLGLTALSIFVNKVGIDFLFTSPTCYKTHFEILQWCFFLHIILFFQIRFWNPSNYLCSFYILPCRVTGFQIKFASISNSTCVDVGWVDIIGWYSTVMNTESSSYYLCPCTADKAPCWYLPLQLNTKLIILLCT